MDDLRPAPSPLLKASAFVARWSLALLLFAWLLFAAAWCALHFLIVPRIGELRPQLEAAASRALGVTVRIDSVAAYSTGMIPAFELSDVRLLDAQGRDALRLPRILVSMSAQSLLGLKMEQLHIDRPTLSVRRAADGKITVAGLDFSKGEQSQSPVLHRIFSQPELVIRHGAVVWTDEMRAVPALALRDVDLVVRNRARRHDVRLDATPPPEWGERFAVVARFEQPFLSMDNGRWQEWVGQVYADFAHVDVSQLKRYANLGIEVHQGRGAVRAWVEIRRSELTAATADVALADVGINLDPTLPPLQLASMSGRLAGKLSPGVLEFSTSGLEFETADGLHWPSGNFSIVQTAAAAARPAHGELVADRLDLTALTQIASRLPLGDQVLAAMTRYAPRGLVESVTAKWQGPAGAINKYEAKGRVLDLQVQATPAPAASNPGAAVVPGSPGVSGATLDFDFTESGGKAKLALRSGSVTLPGVFEDPVVPFEQLTGALAWQLDNGKVRVQVSDMRFSNADAAGDLQLEWHTSDPARSLGRSRFPGVLDLHGSLSRADATRVHRYLPLVLHQNVRDYVRDAVRGGAGSDVKFKVKGDLYDMPFDNPKLGEFQISASIKNGMLAYVPRSYQSADSLPWPALAQLSGEFVFDRKSLLVRGARATVAGAAGVLISRAEAAIADLTRAVNVTVALEARGPLSEMLSVVNTSPIGAFAGDAFSRATTTGNAELRVKLGIPLEALEKSTLLGNLVLGGNDLQLSPAAPRFTRMRGSVGFSESGFSVNGLQARLFGGDVRLDGATAPPPPTGTVAARAAVGLSLRAQGVASAEGLRQAPELGFVSRLAQHASGTASYVAALTMRAGVPEISVSSNLAGLALNLPAPLNKGADTILPLRMESALVRESLSAASGVTPRLQDQLVLDLGRVGSVIYVRDLSGPEPRVVRGSIAVGLAADESAPLPQDGVLANINMGEVDFDAWSVVLSKASGTSLTALDAVGNTNSTARSYLPDSMVVRARELTAGGYKLRNVVIGGSREGAAWRANLDADELSGHVEYRQPTGPGAGRFFARLSRLTLVQASAADVEALLGEQPASIPALDVVVDALELRGKKLGRVEIEAVNRSAAARDGGVREWRLNKFNIVTPEAVFRATGNWAALGAQSPSVAVAPAPRSAPEPRRTVMNFRLDINNSGELLTRFGMKDVVRRGKGVMEGQVAWVGSPLALDYPSLGGAFSVNVENGQFLKADPGLAKLLGVLSLQSLPRRLSLDFTDVFTEGFAFDFLRGDVTVAAGIASSNNLQMKGVNAAVLMDGMADLARETQDIRVVVVPEINAGTASLIATVINPAIGLGSFLAQLFLRRPLIEAATQEFHVDGTWVEPRIVRVDRKSRAAAGQKPAAQTDRGASESK